MPDPLIPIPAMGAQFDETGRLKVQTQGSVTDTAGRTVISEKPGIYDLVTGPTVAVNDVVKLNVSDASTVLCHVKNTGTAVMAAGVCAFEGSIDSTDGVNGTWFSVLGLRTSANTAESATPTLALAVGAGLANAWKIPVSGLTWLRVRCTTGVTASSIATWTIARSPDGTDVTPFIATHAVTGSGTFLIGPAAGTNYFLNSAATTNLTSVKATTANLMELTIFNSTAATVYVKLYNKATAPVVATDVPIYVVPVPAGAEVSRVFGLVGKRFASGMGMAITGAAAITDATAVAVGVLVSATHL